MPIDTFAPFRNAMAQAQDTALSTYQIRQQRAAQQREEDINRARTNAMMQYIPENVRGTVAPLVQMGDVAGVQAVTGMAGQAAEAEQNKREQAITYANRILQAPEDIQPAVYETANQEFFDGKMPPWEQGGREIVRQYAALGEQPAVDYTIKQNEEGEYIYMPKSPGRGAIETGISGPQKTGDNINITLSGDKKWQEKTAELAAQKWGEYQDKASLASETRPTIELQKATLESGLKTGAFEPFMNAVGSYVEGLGFDPTKMNLPDPTKGQIFNQATFKQLLDALAAQKGPQTEGDAQRALKTFAGMGNTVQANMFILDYLSEIGRRNEERVEFINNYMAENGNNPENFREADRKYRQYIMKTPAVASSKKTGMPVTFGQYKEQFLANGGDPEKLLENWRKFAGV